MTAHHPAYAEQPPSGKDLIAGINDEIVRLNRRMPDLPPHLRSAVRRRIDELAAWRDELRYPGRASATERAPAGDELTDVPAWARPIVTDHLARQEAKREGAEREAAEAVRRAREEAILAPRRTPAAGLNMDIFTPRPRGLACSNSPRPAPCGVTSAAIRASTAGAVTSTPPLRASCWPSWAGRPKGGTRRSGPWPSRGCRRTARTRAF
jgi:hypothetical protein